jgi:glycosyltransferase involved in cell wall biosynthesis
LANPVILFLIDGLQVGGAERSLLEISTRFTQFSPVVCVLSDSLALLSEFQKSDIKVIQFPLPRNYQFAEHAKKLMEVIREVQPDLIHSYLFHSDMILRYLPVNIPKVTGLVSNSYSTRRTNQLSWKLRIKVQILKLWDKATCKKIDLFISNSEVIRSTYSAQMGIPLRKIKVIPRGRDLEKFVKVDEQNNSEKIFLSVGRLIPSKGFDKLLKAFAEFTAKYPGFRLIIAGEGPERTVLVDLVKSLGLSVSVSLPGTVERIEELFAKASYFFFPSQYEGLPGALIEAMMAKVPIICSDIPENKECVDENMCLFHRVGNQNDLLAQMEKALTVTDWEIRISLAFHYAEAHFEIGKIANQYERTYLELLKIKP